MPLALGRPSTTESPISIGAVSDEIHSANELYPAFDLDGPPDGARGSIDSIIDALLDSLPPHKSDTAASPHPPAPDSTTPFEAPLDVHSTLGKLSLHGFGESTGAERPASAGKEAEG